MGRIPIIIFGAFDRHNFGDMLFPHIVSALVKHDDLVFAGLAERDLRSCGGHKVQAITQVAAQWREYPVKVIHAGGEILTCDAWQSAVMLLLPDEAQATIARLDTRRGERLEWAHAMLGTSAQAPYTLSRSLFPCASRFAYNAVGGVALDECEPAMRAEVLANLRAADEVSVRDTQTHAHLTAAGIDARLMPDAAIMVPELFGARIKQCAGDNPIARIQQTFPQGYVAVQFSADYGDDETLGEIAAQLDAFALSSGYGTVFFRAGAAPWHDNAHCYQRLAARMRTASEIFTSLDVWHICALIASSQAYAGSSLHGRIIAMAYALPRVNLSHPVHTAQPAKQNAFAATWESTEMPVTVEVDEIAEGIRRAMMVDRERLRKTAAGLAANYRRQIEAVLGSV